MTLRFDPFRELDRLAAQMLDAGRAPRVMPMELYRSGDHYVLHADLPGVDPGSVDVNVDGPVFTIRAERTAKWPREGAPVSIRVVLAEDQAMVRGAFAALLDLEADIDVVATASDGLAALAAVREHDPDVLLTDVEMPGASGLDVAGELHRAGCRTRVVVVTTFARSGYLRRAVRAGVTGYVLKDAPVDRLVDTVRRVHAGQRVIDPDLAVAAWDVEDPLTDRERDVVRLAGDGHPNTEIARRLHLAEGTVRNYLSTAITKLGVRNRVEAANLARDRGWL